MTNPAIQTPTQNELVSNILTAVVIALSGFVAMMTFVVTV
jgi:hypothetical protein